MSSRTNFGKLLWEPPAERLEQSRFRGYANWLASQGHPVRDTDYDQVLRWSIRDVPAFWRSIDTYFGLGLAEQAPEIVAGPIDDATWFVGAETNYAAKALDGAAGAAEAVVSIRENGTRQVVSGSELSVAVQRLARRLQELGVEQGDVVAGYLPNSLESVVAFLATAYLGAVWTSCAPEFGAQSVLDRFGQVEPKVMFAVAGYRYRGQWRDRSDVVRHVINGLPTLMHILVAGEAPLSHPRAEAWHPQTAASDDVGSAAPQTVEFNHPLWILYSSGTTGLPKAIVHSHGGILLEHLKLHSLHFDLSPEDRFLWFSTTGWVMWNILVSGLLAGSTIVTFDGDPLFPSSDWIWELAETEALSFLGLSAGHYHQYLKEGQRPGQRHDLSALRSLGSTGSPLSPEANAWMYNAISPDVAVLSISGGTDVATAFVGGSAFLPVRAGLLTRPFLGVDAAAVDSSGRPVTGTVGDFVISKPMPSMPRFFWDDPDRRRLRSAYFDHYPGKWRHGDWIKFEEDGASVIYGRSDATLNRGGVRMGSSEFYRVLDGLEEIEDCLVVDTIAFDARGQLIVFFVPSDQYEPSFVAGRIRDQVRQQLSPRHTPDHVVNAPGIPRTLSGKRMEIPVKRLLEGARIEGTVETSAVQDATVLEFFTAWRPEQEH